MGTEEENPRRLLLPLFLDGSGIQKCFFPGGKTGEHGAGTRTNNKLNPHMPTTRSSRATLIGEKCSKHCAITAFLSPVKTNPLNINKKMTRELHWSLTASNFTDFVQLFFELIETCCIHYTITASCDGLKFVSFDLPPNSNSNSIDTFSLNIVNTERNYIKFYFILF